ncbi:something about silencing, SAS, complex subunit 4-domain-containing protein [Aspergillus cavernicola]|uniref:Something about silencing, SAS, complex subunit 4-domain-containing protein n=1 Tax=Aspergillus cavernicola TaxID=176166 RepID=A0ABR4IVU9_9EURO
MTSTALMAVRSRSLRVSMGSENNVNTNIQPPPAKRPRLHPPSSRRRKSSPDLLDTTIENSPPSASTKLRRPRPLFALSSTSSPPPPGSTPRARNLRLPHHDTPVSSSAALYLNRGRKSPDPLDTISPAPATSSKSAPPKTANTPTSAAYRQRRVTTQPSSKSAPEHVTIIEPTRPRNTTRRPSQETALHQPPGDLIPPLLPVPAGTADRAVPEKRRSLRSHDGGSRARSELALYFPNFEELMSLEPPKTDSLTGNTVIKLIDDLTEPPIPSSSFSGPDADTPFGNPLLNLRGCEVITLPDPPPPQPDTRTEPESGPSEERKEEEDPLNDEVYFKAHRRHERQEKQIRNIERDRAQHEEQRLDRLLDELKSQDWLRIMGITGRSLTDQDKKLYEPKRDYFIQEISALLQKFKIWKEEEKRRKTDKSASFYSDAAESSHAKDKDIKDDEDQDQDQDDVDALAARQLLQEARSATAGKRPKSKPEPEIPPPPLEPDKPFTSFYAKPHLRDQAMSGTRKGRTRLAFGHPIPEMQEKEFDLPSDILTPEAIKSCQRKRRRMKRASLE